MAAGRGGFFNANNHQSCLLACVLSETQDVSYFWSHLLFLQPMMGRCSWGLFMEALLGVKVIPWLARVDVVGARCCWVEPPIAKRTESFFWSHKES